MERIAHTRLMNMVIGLCYKEKIWSSLLRKCGYVLRFIEHAIHTKSGERAVPDIVVVSNRHRHALIIECKGGRNTRADQERRYGDLDPGSLELQVRISGGMGGYTIAYAVMEDGLENIRSHTSFPIMVFSKLSVYGIRTFGVKQVDKKISVGIYLEGMKEPRAYYPFGPDDADFTIVGYVLQELALMLHEKKLRKGIGDDSVVTAMFEGIHQRHLFMSGRHTRQLKSRIRGIIEQNLMTDVDLMAQIKKVQEGDSGPAAMGRLASLCAKNQEAAGRKGTSSRVSGQAEPP